MKAKRIEITIETNRVFVIHRRGDLLEGWCAHCDKQVSVIRLEEVALSGLSLQAIRGQMEAGLLHSTAATGEFSFLCLNSLLE